MSHIDKDEVARIFKAHNGHGIFVAALERVSSKEHLIKLLDLHINVLNPPFLGFSAILGGGIALCRAKFVNPAQQRINAVADRGINSVAERVIFAIIDEVGERSMRGRPTHRALAQATFLGIVARMGIDIAVLNEFYDSEARSCAARIVDQIGMIYGVGKDLTEEFIWRGLGAQIAGEFSAIREFALLNNWLRRQKIAPGIVAYLEKTVRDIDSKACPAYAWPSLHIHEEMKHTAAAFAAKENGLACWNGFCSCQAAEQWTWDAVNDFASAYADFMRVLLEL